MTVNGWHFIKPQRPNIPRTISRRHQLWRINAAVNGAFGVKINKGSKHIFCAADLVQPIMNESEVQASPLRHAQAQTSCDEKAWLCVLAMPRCASPYRSPCVR